MNHKFRVYIPLFNKIYSGFDIYELTLFLKEFKSFKLDIMISTNLFDENGVEIYEGDVVGYDPDVGYVVSYDKHRGGFFPFANDDGCGCCSGHLLNSSMCTVLGNIYEERNETIRYIKGD